MLISNKHFTPVIGLDIHIVILFGFPIPLPHPYIGFVIDPIDYIPFLGATTKINNVPRGKSDTSGIYIILFHIPMGGPFLMAPMIGHDSVNFFGSKKVNVEGNLMTPAGHMLMTCNDIGIPLSLQPGKKFKPIPSMYLPTSFSIPLSFGKPVMVGGPYVPDWSGALLNLVQSFGFGALMKGLGKGLKKVGKKLADFNVARQAKLGNSNKLSSLLCKLGFEPVDLVQGIVIYEGVDFELPGPIPLVWQRSWNSDSQHHGILGHGTHCSYDMRLLEVVEENAIAVLMGDGRSTSFDYLAYIGAEAYNRNEHFTLSKTDNDAYRLFDHKERYRYDFKRLHPQDKQLRLQAITSDSGAIITFHYNNKAQLIRVIDSVGRHLSINNNDEGCITDITAHHQGETRLLVTYAYNDDNDLTQITDSLDQDIHIRYEQHRMLQQTDRNGQSFYWEYDQKGRCIHTWGDDGILEGWIAYFPEQGYNLVTNTQGHTTTYYYTPDFVVTQIKDAAGNSKFTDYTDYFEIYREIDEEGNVTGFTYDDRGNCVSIVKPDASTYTMRYDEEGRKILTASPQGDSRTYIYYQEGPHQGLLHTITEADGSIHVFRYNQRNLIRAVENESDQLTVMTYDDDANLASITLPDGAQATWRYDAWGHCLHTSNPLRQEQYFQYDALGRITDVRMPDGNQIHLQYNAYEEVIEAQDKHRHVKFEYTPLGSLKSREENGTAIHYLYNKDEQVTALVNEHGEMFKFRRDQRGDVIQETGFDGMVRDYHRDPAGKVVSVTQPGDRHTEFEYDQNGRLIRAVYNDGQWETYSYDKNGRLLEAVNEYSTIRFERDVMGRIIKEWQDDHVVSTRYGKDGNKTAVTSSLGASIQLSRNTMGDVSAISATHDGLLTPWTAHIERNLLGIEIERTLPGGVKSSWTFDQAGMPDTHTISVKGREMRSRRYRWDANHRLKSLATGSETIRFGHDTAGYLAWAQYQDGHYDYRLPDKAGNTYRTENKKDRKYTAGGRLEETRETRFSYDAQGNMVKKIMGPDKIWEYVWSDNGQLQKVIRPDGAQVEFTYDPLGRRKEKLFKQRITRYVWDGNTLLHEWSYPAADKPKIIVDETGVAAPDRPEPVPAHTLTTWVFEDGTFAPSAKIIGDRSYSIINDHLGTPLAAYDEQGEKIWTCELDIYGKVRKLEGDRHLVPFRYQGQYEDAETGLYYNRFRYYSPDEGVYLSQDPVGLAGGMSFYAYVGDPNIWVDIFGLKCAVPPKKVNFTAEGVSHVKDRHIGNHPDWTHKSKWTVQGGEWRAKARDTFRNPDRVSRDGTRYVFEKEYKKPVGVDRDGNDIFKVRVVTEENGDLVTTFPQTDWK